MVTSRPGAPRVLPPVPPGHGACSYPGKHEQALERFNRSICQNISVEGLWSDARPVLGRPNIARKPGITVFSQCRLFRSCLIAAAAEKPMILYYQWPVFLFYF